MKTKVILIALVSFLMGQGLYAQFIEDALRFSQSNGIMTTRAGSFNVAFHGVSDDFAALSFNPAGLSFVPKNEFTLGFGFLRNNTTTDFLKTENLFNSNDAFLNHVGFVAPFRTKKGNAAVGIGYYLENNFDNTMEFSAFNGYSSMIDYWARTEGQDLDNNRASALFLADRDPATQMIFTPINDSLQQSSFIKEAGGLHNIIGGAAFSLNEFVSIGFSLVGKWGSYTYAKTYEETDLLNKYDEFDTTYSNIDFKRLQVDQDLKQDFSGISGSVGIMGKIEEFMRFGATVKFPTFFEVEETFSDNSQAFFDNGESYYYNIEGENSYKVTTPWVYSAGVSLHAKGITFSAGVEYSDVTQMEFSDGLPELEDLNADIVRDLVGQTTWGIAVEYEIPLMPIVARAGYSSKTSPYSQDIPGASVDNFSIGAGLYLAKNVRIDGLFRYTDYSELRVNYGAEGNGLPYSYYTFDASPLNLSLQLTYRFD